MKYIITGASSGIGRRCAERLLQKGNDCLLIARSYPKLQEIKNIFPKAIILSIDLSDIGSIEKCIYEQREFFPFDGLIHCAGISPLKRVDENDKETVRLAYETNVFSFIELMRLFVQDGVCNKNASVVVMSSVVAHRGSNRQSIYSGTKSALEGTVRCMAKELIGKSIRVNSIVSGIVDTEMLNKLRIESPNLDDKIKDHHPLGVIPVDLVCDIIEYLLSESSSHVTGASFPIDSGYLL